ncbi:MAG: substrate-binding domain-containing protein, partial [Gordonia sp. (in: high G+C Gram-positive bacteria)]|uniref:substrate-binding domain-containing protein n=1 Tax=Gordonia sp. (in: high G+C Gram-positive bacteria) TaxID=84139 RepID=UPI003BB6FF14
MGTHENDGRRQPVSNTLLASVLAAILVTALVLAWRDLPGRVNDSPSTSAGCHEGRGLVSVAVDPAIAPALQESAAAFNTTAPVVRNRCIEIEVRPVDARGMLEGLSADTWDAQSYGVYPGAWIPESSIWAAALQVGKPSALAGTPTSLVYSPVRLAMETQIAAAADGAISWSDLPSLTRANSLGEYGRSSWGSLRLAMPQGPQSDATSLAALAVAAATVPTADPLTAEQASTAAVTTAMNELMSAPPRVGDGSAEAAVTEIADTTVPATATVRAVPISEQRIYLSTKNDDSARLAVVEPHGPTPVLDYPVITLGGSAVPAYVTEATAEFLTFARTPDQIARLGRSGFR